MVGREVRFGDRYRGGVVGRSTRSGWAKAGGPDCEVELL
jgi:hypothetical protein